jgi:hypothetical protein
MAAMLAEIVGAKVIATDIFDYGFGKAPVDFLVRELTSARRTGITNPPFKAVATAPRTGRYQKRTVSSDLGASAYRNQEKESKEMSTMPGKVSR